jgi:hypothetical protein
MTRVERRVDMGTIEIFTISWSVPSVVRYVKGSEENLSQWVNCYASNAGTSTDSLRGRRADRQCLYWGSEAVVVGGFTTTQGERENRSQGKGPYITRRDMTLSCGRTGRRNMETIYAQRG